MGRRLNTYVHVDGVPYGPDDDLPEEIAERIVAPWVWEGSEEADPAPVEKPPARRAAPKA